MVFKTKYTDEEIAELLERNYQKFEGVKNDFYTYTCRVCHKKGEKHRQYVITYNNQASPICNCLRRMGFIPLFISADGRFICIKCSACGLEKMHRFTDGPEKTVCATPFCDEEKKLAVTKRKLYISLRKKKFDQFGDWVEENTGRSREANKEYIQGRIRDRVKRAFSKKANPPQIPLDDNEQLLKHFEYQCFFCGHEIKTVNKKTFTQLGNEMVPECGFCRKQRKDAAKAERRKK